MIYHSPIGILDIALSQGKITEVKYIDHEYVEDGIPLPIDVKKAFDDFFTGRSLGVKFLFEIDTSPFYKKVYAVIQSIPYGKTLSYKEIGLIIGSRAYRAIGTACKRNPIPLVIPCHRVVSSSGIGGYSAGLDKKRWLLDFEKKYI